MIIFRILYAAQNTIVVFVQEESAVVPYFDANMRQKQSICCTQPVVQLLYCRFYVWRAEFFFL